MSERLRAPLRRYRVEMVKRTCSNAVQNARQVIEYVDATSEQQALTIANAIPIRAAFKAVAAKKI